MGAKGKVLVVDDHDSVGKLIAAIVRVKDYEVAYAPTGEDAMPLLAGGGIGLVFLDIMLPGMDGFTICEKLKADPATRKVPVVFITARGKESDRLRAREVGGEGLITKPFRTDDILGALEEYALAS